MPAAPPGWLLDVPQGFFEKIELDRLLADLPLKFVDA
jgi:hypothetical protein